MRAVIYARYSSELQREASIGDQVENDPAAPTARAPRTSRVIRWY